MMVHNYFVCYDCGRNIHETDVKCVTEDHGEKWFCCPWCGGDLGEAYRCEGCGEKVLKEDLYNDYCEECLLAKIDEETFLKFALDEDGTDVSMLEEFFFVQIFGFTFDTMPRSSTEAFRDFLITEYHSQFRGALADDFLAKIKDFVRKWYFSEWADFIE